MPLAALIRSQKENILVEWEELVRSLYSARKLPHPLLRNHMPELLDWIVARLERESVEEDGYPHEQTLEHALGRIKAGYDLAELLSEYMVLRDCLHAAWERAADERVQPKDVRRLNQVLDDNITYTAVFYCKSRMQQNAALPTASAPPAML